MEMVRSNWNEDVIKAAKNDLHEEHLSLNQCDVITGPFNHIKQLLSFCQEVLLQILPVGV